VSIKVNRRKNTLLKKSVMVRVFNTGRKKSCRQFYLKMETVYAFETSVIRQQVGVCQKSSL